MTLLLGMIALVVLALAGLVVANLVSGATTTAFQNDDYQVPPPDRNPPPIPAPNTYGEAEDWLTEQPALRPVRPGARCVATVPRSTSPMRATNSCRRTSTV